MAMFLAAEKFLAKHIGGRAQDSAKEEVTKRLAEITVDPKTVKLKAKTQPSGAAKADGALFKPGSSNYSATVALGERKMNMKVVSAVKPGPGGWLATEVATTPGGEMTESAVLAKDTLHLQRRTAKQGPMSYQFDVKDGKAVGTMSMNGQDRPIDIALPGPLFADGAGSPQAVGTLPLAVGYKSTFLNLDMKKLKVKPMDLEVLAEEIVTVPAGTFEAWKLVVNSEADANEKLYLWIDIKSRRFLKASSALAEMGGALMTVELQP
jgi:hypothetical protein